MHLEKIGVLAPLPKVELAKLAGETEEFPLSAGHSLEVQDAVYFVCSGALQLHAPEADRGTGACLAVVGPGGMVGEWLLLPVWQERPVVVAASDSVVLRVHLERWRALIRRHPEVGHMFQTSLLERLQQLQRSLAQSKRYLEIYASELWSTDEPKPLADASAEELALALDTPVLEQEPPVPDIGPVPALVSALPEPAEGKQFSWLFWGVSGAALAAASSSVAMLGFHGALNALVVVVLAWTGLNWYLSLIPDYAVALVACMATVLLGIAKAGETFSGFADPTWFLLLGAFGIGAAIQKSGLLYRISLHLLRILPPTYTGQAAALALSGTLLTPCLPSVQSRVAMAGLMARELSEAMRFPAKGKGSAGLAMSAFLGFGQMRFLFLNGSSYSLLAWGLLPLAVRQGASWAQWFWVALPLGLVTLLVTHWATVHWLFKEQPVVIAKSAIDRQLAILGRMSGREKTTAWVTVGVMLGFILQPLLRVDASWVALTGFLLLVVFGIVDKESVVSKIDWQYMLFYGSLAGLVALIAKSQLSDILAQTISQYLGLMFTNTWVFFLGLTLLTILLRTLFQPGPSIILLGVTFFPLSASLGYNPLVVAVVLVAASTTWLIPQLLSSYTTLHSTTQGRCFDQKQVRPLAWIHAMVVLAAVACSIPFWQLFGFLGGR